MKKFLSIFVLNIFSLALFANVESYLMYAKFNSPEGPYVETYMSTIGNSLVYKQANDGNYQAELEITMVFRIADSVITINKYNLLSPSVTDSLGMKPNFIDMQRIHLANGSYNFDISIKDINSNQNPVVFSDIVTIDFNENKLGFGGIQYIESIMATQTESVLSKNGYDIQPYVSSFFPANIEKLSFYIEVYNTNKVINDEFILRYYIENYETGTEIDKYSRFKRMSSSEFIPFIGEINIIDLRSGNYNLVLDVRNKENLSLKKTKYFFQRSNTVSTSEKELAELIKEIDVYSTFSGDMTSADSLRNYISSLWPISGMDEQRFIDYQVKDASLEALQNYFTQFWISRDNLNPNSLWREYKTQVEFVEKLYGTSIRKGYNTDQGIIYLKYGAPNNIYTSKHEPSAYPYEIWTYWKINNQSNGKFVFYNPRIAGKEYDLLHSNVRGELNTPNWEVLLQKRNHSLYNFDEKTSEASWGSRALEEFNK